MADYDNTNSGALFAAEHMKIIRQGKVNVDGVEDNYVLVQTETAGGKTIFEMYQKVGALFVNDKKRTENDPDISGSVTDKSSGEWRFAGWKKTSKAGDQYTSIGVRRPQEMPAPTSPAPTVMPISGDDPTPIPAPLPSDDKIPF